jgi:hypothetical protein
LGKLLSIAGGPGGSHDRILQLDATECDAESGSSFSTISSRSKQAFLADPFVFNHSILLYITTQDRQTL